MVTLNVRVVSLFLPSFPSTASFSLAGASCWFYSVIGDLTKCIFLRSNFVVSEIIFEDKENFATFGYILGGTNDLSRFYLEETNDIRDESKKAYWEFMNLVLVLILVLSIPSYASVCHSLSCGRIIEVNINIYRSNHILLLELLFGGVD